MIFNWGEHSPEKKLALALLAECSEAPGTFVSARGIRRGIKKNKLNIELSHEQLNSVLAELFQDEHVLQKDHKYGFRLDLFRRWVRHDHNIWQVKKEIDPQELARITKLAREQEAKLKKALTVTERVVMIVAIVTAVALGTWVYNLLTEKPVVFSANGGPFSVWVNDDSIGTSGKTDPTQFVIGSKLRFFEKKPKEGETYRFRAKMLATGETTPDTSVTIGENNQHIKFKFREYPVAITTDAESIIAQLGGETVRTAGQAEPWKCTFNITAGAYPLAVWTPQNDRNRIDTTITVPAKNDIILIDFPGLVVITLQANLPFDYQYKTNRKNGYGQSNFQAENLHSDIIRGCTKGEYHFTLTSPRGEPQISAKHITMNDTIKVKFDPNWKRQPTTITTAPTTTNLPKTHRLRIETDPNGAEVILEGVKYRPTPFEEILKESIYRIELSKEGYDILQKLIYLTKDTTIVEKLAVQYGYLKVIVMDRDKKRLTGVSVYGKKDDWDKEEFWGDARKIAREGIRLMAGRYKIRAVCEGYNEGNGEGYVLKSTEREITITLTKS
jgi:hypothetical protein